MFASSLSIRRLLGVVAVALIAEWSAQPALAQSVPILVQAEAMTLNPSSTGPMTVGYDIAAIGGRFISQASGTPPASPSTAASKAITVAPGTYYLWARIAGPTLSSDALNIGIDGTFARVFPAAQGAYEWVRVPATTNPTSYGLSLNGSHTIEVSSAELGAKLDALYLTADASEVPTFGTPSRLLIEAEIMTLHHSSMTIGNDNLALGGKYLSTSAPNSTTPVRRASVPIHFPAGTYYLWARLGGASIGSDAFYVGIDSSFARTFPDPTAAYKWVKVKNAMSSSTFNFSLSAGVHDIQIGEAETNARLDAFYLTDDPNDVPTTTPTRRIIEAESFTLDASATPPITVGEDVAALNGQSVGATTGSAPTSRIRGGWTTIQVPVNGTYYLWARVQGATSTSDASYVGFNNTWDRVFPNASNAYQWVKVENDNDSGAYGTALSAGPHDIQIGVGEIGARIDAVYVTDDPEDVPTAAPSNPTNPPASPDGPPAVTTCAPPSGGYEGFGGQYPDVVDGTTVMRTTTGGAAFANQPKSVNKLADTTEQGTLRWALNEAQTAGGGCIRFDIGGPITLGSDLRVPSNVTIDGLTAPNPGITLKNRTLLIDDARNVIVRGLRFRDNRAVPDETDAIAINSSRGVVIDRVSIHNPTDGAIDVTRHSPDPAWPATNVTIQWSIFGAGADANPFLLLIAYGAERVSVHHNLFHNGKDRQPMARRETGDTSPHVVMDVRNNVVWNYTQWGTTIRNGAKANVVKNYYKAGPSRGDADAIREMEGGTAFVSENFSKDGFNLNDNGSPVPEFAAVKPATQAPQRAAELVRDHAGAPFDPDGDDAAVIGSISVP